MPKTCDHVQSVHIDLTANKVSDSEAMTIINRFLSLLTWCDDQFAIAQEGWSGNPVPVAVPRRNLAFATAFHWTFDGEMPDSANARRALALYREARNAQQNFMVSYAVLNFYKILEIGRSDPKGGTKKWLQDNFDVLKLDIHQEEFGKFAAVYDNSEAKRNGKKPHEYIYDTFE